MKYFVGIKTLKMSPVKYYTMKNNVGASRMIAFKNINSAVDFKDYLAKYRSLYNHWPVIDASLKEQYVNTQGNTKHHSPGNIYKLLKVVGWEDVDVDELSHSSVDIIEVTSFNYDFQTNMMRMTAFDLPNSTSIEDFRQKLKFNLKSVDDT